MVGEGFDGGLGDEDVDFAFDSVKGYGIVSCIWGEDCDCGTGSESIDCGFVGIGISGIIWRVRFE